MRKDSVGRKTHFTKNIPDLGFAARTGNTRNSIDHRLKVSGKQTRINQGLKRELRCRWIAPGKRNDPGGAKLAAVDKFPKGINRPIEQFRMLMLKPIKLRIIRCIRQSIGTGKIKDHCALSSKYRRQGRTHNVFGSQKNSIKPLRRSSRIRHGFQHELCATKKTTVNFCNRPAGVAARGRNIKMRQFNRRVRKQESRQF